MYKLLKINCKSIKIKLKKSKLLFYTCKPIITESKRKRGWPGKQECYVRAAMSSATCVSSNCAAS